MSALWGGHAGAAARCCLHQGGFAVACMCMYVCVYMCFRAVMLAPLRAAVRMCVRFEWRACFGAGLLWLAGAIGGRCLKLTRVPWSCCKAPLHGSRVSTSTARVQDGLWSWRWCPWGAVSGCGCTVLWSKGHLVLQTECSVRSEAWVLVWLQGVVARCVWQCGRWAVMEVTFTPKKG